MSTTLIIVGLFLILFMTGCLLRYNPLSKKESLASVGKECVKDRYQEEERDIYSRWPYIEYEPDCKWRRFDSIRY